MSDTPADLLSVDAWLLALAAELPAGFDADLPPEERDALLDLARVAAHRSERIAAPLTTFLLGLAMASDGGQQRAGRIRAITARLDLR